MYSTKYIVTFILILTAITAVTLAGLREVTKAKAELNEEIFEKRAILSAIEDHLPNGMKVKQLSDEEVINIFNNIEQITLDMTGMPVEGSVMAEDIDMAKERKKPEAERLLPLFIYEHEGSKYYIVSIRGNGLWDEIWGNIALEGDLNTITGAAFDHKGETPGLGAEIKDNPAFAAKFKGTKIYENEEYVSVVVRKGGVKKPEHEVDAISGATVTCNGVSEMLYRGIKYYEPYFQTIRKSDG